MRSTQTQQRRNAYAIATIYYNIKREGRGYNIDLVGTAQRLRQRQRERDIQRFIFGGNTKRQFRLHAQRERGRSSGFHLFPSLATVLMPLGFLYQVLSLSLIRSDFLRFLIQGQGFVLFSLNSIPFLFVFQRFRLTDEDLNRSNFFFSFWDIRDSISLLRVWFVKFEVVICY